MKFIMQLPNGSFHVPSAALKISGLEGGDRIEIHTLERAAVIIHLPALQRCAGP